jgi:hypothetical protein
MQGDAVNKQLRKSVEGKSLAPWSGLELTTLRLIAHTSEYQVFFQK